MGRPVIGLGSGSRGRPTVDAVALVAAQSVSEAATWEAKAQGGQRVQVCAGRGGAMAVVA